MSTFTGVASSGAGARHFNKRKWRRFHIMRSPTTLADSDDDRIAAVFAGRVACESLIVLGVYQRGYLEDGEGEWGRVAG
jgi:hypothetical protein